MDNILEYLEQSARLYPQKTAFADAENEISFSNLENSAKAIACALIPHATARSPIAVYTEKYTGAIAAFMGAVYAGCFYSLLEPTHPAARTNSIIKTLEPAVILTNEENYEKVKQLEFNGTVLLIKEAASTALNAAALAQRRKNALSTDPLYCNFTSGSTGTPKGVLVGHASVLDFIPRFAQLFGFSNDDIIANQAPLDFDVSVKDIYTGLYTGACTQLVPRAYFSAPAKLMDFLAERGATSLTWAVSALCMVSTMQGLEYRCPTNVRRILFSGESMPVKHLNHWRQFLPNALYVNLYGPTEITCNCTYYVLNREFEIGESIPIGESFANENVFLLDENDKLIEEKDVLGEICVAGTALALGYYNDPERTAAVFCQNPLNKNWPERIYRTGDLGHYDKDNLLVYNSRKDFQIKHLGQRIELGDIEAALGSLSGVERAACLYDERRKKIVAFYEGTPTPAQIVEPLKEKLPQYMLPNKWNQLEKMPLSANGKIDRASLRDMLK